MLTIRQTQLDRLERCRLDTFIDEMVERARIRHPDATRSLTLDELRAAVSDEVACARRDGVVLKGHLKRYLDLSFSVHPGFGCEAWAREVLSNADIAPAVKLWELEKSALFRVR